VAAAAAASGPGFLARASAAAPVGNAALAAPTRPRCMATPLSAAAATTHATRAHMPITRKGRLPRGTYTSLSGHRIVRTPGCTSGNRGARRQPQRDGGFARLHFDPSINERIDIPAWEIRTFRNSLLN